ncbi:craniofacial development protein 2-like [Amphiura filiformis]|uniref:craniofacial development protein 2-like n=1 Tax=Amphiura filiformis TaxID=82378 RepID=UPI003B222915
MNVRTIRENRCREELVSNLIEYNIDILGIQEHRIVHKEPVKYEDILGQTLITTSATRNRAERILVANFQGNLATTVIVTYCPTNVEDEDKVEDHYDNLRRTIDSIPAHNVLMVIGDFNGRIGTEDAKFTYHDMTNRNGKFLVDLAIEKNLICANTYFRKRKGKLWTFCSPAGSKYQLDYILLRKKWRNSLLNAEAYNTVSSVGSDHRIVTSRIRLSLRKTKTLPRGRTMTGKHSAQTPSFRSNILLKYTTGFNPWRKWRKQLLRGSPPEIDGEDEDIVPVAKDLNINVAPFSQEEYAKAKSALVEGKSCERMAFHQRYLKDVIWMA